ncbi:hypothetical protein OS31_30800 [Dickeya oryzae]
MVNNSEPLTFVSFLRDGSRITEMVSRCLLLRVAPDREAWESRCGSTLFYAISLTFLPVVAVRWARKGNGE